MVWLTLGLTRGWGSIIINGWGVGLVYFVLGLGKLSGVVFVVCLASKTTRTNYAFSEIPGAANVNPPKYSKRTKIATCE